MHQGNIFINENGQIVPVDFGIMGRVDKINRRFLAEILYGFIQRDYKKVAEVHILAGLVPKNTQMESLSQALRSIGEPYLVKKLKIYLEANFLNNFLILQKNLICKHNLNCLCYKNNGCC